VEDALNEAINRLTRDFIENARKRGVEVEKIEVDWTNGKYDAKVKYSPHRPRLEPLSEVG